MHYGAEHTHGARVSDAWTYRGLKTVVLENEHLRVVILADKGADVASLVHKPTDTEFLFRSPWGVRNPKNFVPTDGSGVSTFLDYYEGGWQTALPNFGFVAEHHGASFGLHGEASTLPWDARILEEGPEHAAVEFRVRLARSPFVITKVFSLASDSHTLALNETVENVGREAMELSYGQHMAYGAPFLSPDCVIDLPGGTVLGQPEIFHECNRLSPGFESKWPMAPARNGETVDLRRIPPKDAGYYDMAYIAEMPEGWYAITNQASGLGLAVRYPVETFRYLWYWQMFGGGLGYPWWGQTYNIGLEPATSWPNDGLEGQRANGSAWRLEAGAGQTNELRVTVYRSTSGVTAVGPDGEVTVSGKR